MSNRFLSAVLCLATMVLSSSLHVSADGNVTASPSLAALLTAITAPDVGAAPTAAPGTADLLTLYKNTATTTSDRISKLGTGQNLLDRSADLSNLYTNSDFSDFLRVDRGYLNLIGNLELDTFAKAVAPAIGIYAADLAVVNNILSTVAAVFDASAAATGLYATILTATNDQLAAAGSGVSVDGTPNVFAISNIAPNAGLKGFTDLKSVQINMAAALNPATQLAALDKATALLQKLQVSYPTFPDA